MNWAANWSWASSLDQIWRSPTFPMWLTLAAAGFFGIIVLVTLLRAEKSVANGALAVITLLAITVAVAATIRGFGPFDRVASNESSSVQPVNATVPALATSATAGEPGQVVAPHEEPIGWRDVVAARPHVRPRLSRLRDRLSRSPRGEGSMP